MDAYKPLSSILSDWSFVSGRGIWEEMKGGGGGGGLDFFLSLAKGPQNCVDETMGRGLCKNTKLFLMDEGS